MILAVNPQNQSLRCNDMEEVFSQGELLFLLAKNPSSEVLLDRELPGNLMAETLVDVIHKLYPEVQVSIIETEQKWPMPMLYQPMEEKMISKQQTWVPYLAASIAWLLVMGVVTIGLPEQQIWMLYAGIGGLISAVVFGSMVALAKGGEGPVSNMIQIITVFACKLQGKRTNNEMKFVKESRQDD